MLRSRRLFAIPMLLLVLLLVASCAAPAAAPAEPAAEEATAEEAPAEEAASEEAADVDVDALLAELPEELAALYEKTTDPILPSAYDGFEAVEGPWKICYADSYQGNPWRVAVYEEMVRLADEFAEAGKVESFENAVSNNDVAQNISNIRTYIDKECDVIITIPESATGLNEVIKDAYDAGIPVVTMAGTVTSPYAVNVNSNYYKWGADMAQGIADELGGAGNVLQVEGIAGHPIVLAQAQGFDDVMSQYPDINVVATVNGDWTPSVTKQAVLQTLATQPDVIDAVWTTGSESRVIAEAFAEAGSDVPLITGSLTGDIMGYWNENGDEGFRFYGHGVLPHWTAQTGFRTAVRLLEGQHPKLSLLEIPLPEVVQADLPGWYEDCMTPDSTSLFPVPPSDPFSEEMLDAYFVNGAPTAPYDYANVPSACAE